MKEIRQRVASNLRRLRHVAGLSQEELAFRAKVDRSYISLIENERYNPSIAVLDRLARALEVDLSALVAAQPVRRKRNLSKKV